MNDLRVFSVLSQERYLTERLSTLKETTKVLECFRTSITQYISWWTRMKMTMDQQANSTNELKKFYSQVRKQNVAQKWEKLSTDFQEYSNKVSELPVLGSCTSYLTFIAIQMRLLQDKYPGVLLQMSKTGASESGVLTVDVSNTTSDI